MKVLSLIAFCILSLTSFAGKPYTISVKVVELGSLIPLDGIDVVFSDEDNEVLFKTVTDKEGKANYPDCVEKAVSINVSDPKGNHQDDNVFFFREYDDPTSILFRLRLPIAQEQLLIASKTVKVEDSTALEGKDDCSDSLTWAEYPGGVPELRKYIANNIKYPEIALEMGISGKCYLQFYIDTEGTILGITVKKGVPDCPECDEESIRVIAYMPKWIPATCNGEAVPSYYNLPISYKAQ